MSKRNVLVFPAGTEIGLEINNSLKHCKEVGLFGAGQDISNHARFAYREYHTIPSIRESGWLQALINLVKRMQIDYIFPAYDDVIVALSQTGDTIPAVIISSPAWTCEICRSKSETYRFLGNKVRVPKIYTGPKEVDVFPVFLKPDRGQGSQGTRIVECPKDLSEAERSISSESLICEYLPGEEYTVDCFSDRARGLLFAGARTRRRTRNGISMNTVTVHLPEAHSIAKIIGETLAMRGAWFFQLKRAPNGELVLLEVAPRIAGSMASHRVMGVNFPLLSIFEHERLPINILANPGRIELDRALCNRYRHEMQFSTLYIDLDDTLLLDGQINLPSIKLIFQCINQGKRVQLITRHRGDLAQMLEKYRLQSLFDEVIHVPESGAKSEYITERDAIFVDDSFSERLEVSRNCQIPTLDSSMLELLTEQAECLSIRSGE
jgi:hypothetical protein